MQGASQGASKRQSKVQGASKRQSKAQLGPFLRKAQPSPVEGTIKRHLAGSILGTVCKEGNPTTSGKVPNPTTLGIFFPVRQNDDVPKKGPRLDSPQARPSAKQSKEQAEARPRGDPKPRRVQEATEGAVCPFLYIRHSQGPLHRRRG